MRYYIVLSIIILTISCNRVNYLYYYDNTDIEAELNNMPDCEGLAELVRNNFLYNAEDSLYVYHIGFTRHTLPNYKDCFSQLSTEQKKMLFGIPNTIYDGEHLMYFTNKLEPLKIKRITYYNGLGMFKGFPKDSYPLENMLEKTSALKKAKKFTQPRNYLVEGGDELHPECMKRKENLIRQVFVNKKKGTVFVNTTLTQLTKNIHDDKLNLNCNATFTSNEIKSLFGQPHLVSADTMFYRTMATPYMDKNGQHPEWLGKVYCIIFYKSGFKDYYQYDSQMVEANRLL